MQVRRIIREPLLHFFVIGAVLFITYDVLNVDELQAPDEIVVDHQRITAISKQFEQVWQRPPTAEELDGLIESWVREEVLYREGLAMRLDDDDPVIRRRIAQKVAFMSDAGVDEDPDEAALQAWLDADPERYRLEPKVDFRQVYIDPRRHADDLDAYLLAVERRLASGDETDAGDATLLPAGLTDASLSEVSRAFGNRFSEELVTLPREQWAGPVASGFGLHFVRIQKFEPEREASLDEVRQAVERDLVAARREASDEALYRAMRERYRIVMPDEATTLASSQP